MSDSIHEISKQIHEISNVIACIVYRPNNVDSTWDCGIGKLLYLQVHNTTAADSIAGKCFRDISKNQAQWWQIFSVQRIRIYEGQSQKQNHNHPRKWKFQGRWFIHHTAINVRIKWYSLRFKIDDVLESLRCFSFIENYVTNDVL